MKFEYYGFGRWKWGAGSITCAQTCVEIRKVATVSIPYGFVSSVHVSAGGLLAKPYIQIVGPGERPVFDVRAAMQHPCCLTFRRSDLKIVSNLKAEIERRIRAARGESAEAPLGVLAADGHSDRRTEFAASDLSAGRRRAFVS